MKFTDRTKTVSIFLIVFLMFTLITVVYATDYFESGLETADFSEWDGTTNSPTITQTNVLDGEYASQHSFTGAYQKIEAYYDLKGNQPHVFVRDYFMINGSLPSSGQSCYINDNDAQNYGRLMQVRIYNIGGTLYLGFYYQYPSTVIGTYGYAFSLGIWYYVECEYIRDGSNGGYRLWFCEDGGTPTLIFQYMNLNTSNWYYREHFIGYNSNSHSAAHTVCFDDVKISDSYIGVRSISEKSWNHSETWRINLYNYSWKYSEIWKINLHAYSWFNVEIWKLALSTLDWYHVETWLMHLYTQSWYNAELWTLHLYNYSWFAVETWKLTLSNLNWFLAEIWQTNLYPHGWYGAEIWLTHLHNYSWFVCEIWQITLGYGYWYLAEIWKLSIVVAAISEASLALSIGVLAFVIALCALGLVVMRRRRND
jgi:hypothetical protein